MSPNPHPVRRHGRNRLMEIRSPSGSSTNPILCLTADQLTILSDTLMLGNTLPVHVPEVTNYPRVSLFEQLVLSIRKANAMNK